MESRTLQAFLRILYTVNNSPQYILAKSSSQVSTVVCDGTTAQPQFVYARAPLKACLAAICDSSPELLFQDPPRDFSIYVLDPLEAQPLPTSLIHTSHNTGSPPGVAVALGLMSRALESDSSPDVLVTGTIIPNATPALEVVFALREAKCMPKPALQSCSSLSSTSILHPPPTQTAGNSISAVQEQQTLTRSADFPEFYIGPPRRMPGRPEGSTSKPKLKSQSSTASLAGASTSMGVDDLKQDTGGRSKKRTKPKAPRVPPTLSPFICEPLVRSTATVHEASATGIPNFYAQSLGQNQTQPHSQSRTQANQYLDAARNPLLQLLFAISSTSTGNTANTSPEQQAALLAVLQNLLSGETSIGSSASNRDGNLTAGKGRAEDERDDGESDIVILDASTIDTTAFRRSGPRQFAASNDTPSLTTKQESPIPTIPSAGSSPLPPSAPSSQPEDTLASQVLTPTVAHTSKQVPGRTNEGDMTPKHGFEMPRTPTRKRKLDEYAQDEARSSPPSPPPSPSPYMTRAPDGALTAKRILPSPTTGLEAMSSPVTRLPSVLSSICSLASSGAHLHAGSSSSSARGNWLLSDENQWLIPGLRSSPDGSNSTDVLSNVASDATLLKRRRTLNEVMEEREARKHTKDRRRPHPGRKDVSLSTNTSQAAPALFAKVASTSRQAQSSPPRPLFRSESMAPLRPLSFYHSRSAAADPTPAVTAPCKDSLTTGPAENPFKNFVVPAWARTETAMLPRLSEEALARQQAEQKLKQAQISMKRRESAKAKRGRLRAAEHPSKESSDDGAVANEPKRRSVRASSSNAARGAPSLPPPPASLPVFASDAIEPIPSSPPRSHRQLTFPVVPSTPPRKPVSPGSAPHRTPRNSGACSLFTPSSNGHASLFTPTTPSATRSLAGAAATPRSPTVLHHSIAQKTPRKGVGQTPWTPKRSGGHHQTPRSLRSGRSTSFCPPHTGIGTRAFLLPPPSPCTSRTPHLQSQICAISECSPPTKRSDPEVTKSHSDGQHVDRGEDTPSCRPDGTATAPGPPSPTLRTVDETGESGGMSHSNDNVPQEQERYVFSPLPPSSPLPASPFSSPAKQRDSDIEMPIADNLAVPDSDILLPSASDSDGSQRKVNANWLSEEGCATAWFTESEASAWFTETEAWLTDTDGGGPFMTDSDTVFGPRDMSALPHSSASNWFSDDADVDTDAEGGGQEGALDTAAFERAFVALVERGAEQAQCAVGRDEESLDTDAFWTAIRPFLGNPVAEPGTESGNVVEEV